MVYSAWYCDADSLDQLNCSDGEVVTYDSSSSGWVCSSVLTLLDEDGDGVVSGKTVMITTRTH